MIQSQRHIDVSWSVRIPDSVTFAANKLFWMTLCCLYWPTGVYLWLPQCCIMQSVSSDAIISQRTALLHTEMLWSWKLSAPHPPSLLLFHSKPHLFGFLLAVIFLLIRLTPSFSSSSVGRLLIEFSSQMTMERVQKENPNVTEGGRYSPPDCRPRWKVLRRARVCSKYHLVCSVSMLSWFNYTQIKHLSHVTSREPVQMLQVFGFSGSVEAWGGERRS